MGPGSERWRSGVELFNDVLLVDAARLLTGGTRRGSGHKVPHVSALGGDVRLWW